MYLEDIDLYCDDDYGRRKEFYLLITSVEHLYKRCLPKMRTGPIGKVVIQAIEPGVKKPPLTECEDVLEVYGHLDLDALWKTEDEFARKKQVLEFIHRMLLKVAVKQGWDSTLLKEAYACALERQLVNEEYVGKPVASPNRQLRSQVFYSFGTKTIDVFLIITTPQGEEVQKIPVGKVRSSSGEGGFQHLLGKLKWLSNAQIQVTFRDGAGQRKFKVKPPK